MLANANAYNNYFFEVEHTWGLLKDNLFTVEMIPNNAMHHKLSPAIRKLCDTEIIFQNATSGSVSDSENGYTNAIQQSNSYRTTYVHGL